MNEKNHEKSREWKKKLYEEKHYYFITLDLSLSIKKNYKFLLYKRPWSNHMCLAYLSCYYQKRYTIRKDHKFEKWKRNFFFYFITLDRIIKLYFYAYHELIRNCYRYEKKKEIKKKSTAKPYHHKRFIVFSNKSSLKTYYTVLPHINILFLSLEEKKKKNISKKKKW